MARRLQMITGGNLLTMVEDAVAPVAAGVDRADRARKPQQRIHACGPNVDFLHAWPIFSGMSQFPTLFIARRWIKHVLARDVVAALS